MAGKGPGGAPLTSASMLGTVVLVLVSAVLGGGFGLARGSVVGGCFNNRGLAGLGARPCCGM